MATINLTVGTADALPAIALPGPILVEREYDASKQNAAAADVLQLINVPKKSWVHFVQWEVTKVQGGAATFDLGDGDTAAGYESNADANVLGSGISGPVAGYVNTSDAGVAQDAFTLSPAYSGGKYYSAADTIDLTADAALTLAKISVRALITKF